MPPRPHARSQLRTLPVDAAIAELAEKDRRIAAWEQVVSRALDLSANRSAEFPVDHQLHASAQAIPAELRPGGKS